MYGMPPILDYLLTFIIIVASIFNLAMARSPRIGGGEIADAARCMKFCGWGMLGFWFAWRLYLTGDLRISSITGIALTLLAFADLLAGAIRLGEAKYDPREQKRRVKHWWTA